MSKIFPQKAGETRCIIASKSGVMSLGYVVSSSGKGDTGSKRVRHVESENDFLIRNNDPDKKVFISGEYKDAEEIINWISGK